MLGSWLLTAWRYARNSRLYTLLNLAGLATGAAVSILIALWVRDELAFDTTHPNYGRIAQVMDNQPAGGATTTSELLPIPLAAELRDHYGSDFSRIALYFPNFRHILVVGDKSVPQTGSWVQPDLPVMLTLPMLEGSRDALRDRSNVLLSHSLAATLFGAADPMGRTIRVDGAIEVKVGGVFQDLPANSTFHDAGIFLAWDKAVDEMSWMKDFQTIWDARGFKIYVQLNEHADIDRVNRHIAALMTTHTNVKGESIFLHPMPRWHLYNTFTNGFATGGRIAVVRLFAGVGAFVLLLACINFMNLSTARSQRRAREVGIRKVIGSLRFQLVGQFLGEALLTTAAAVVLALGLACLAIPFFNGLAGKQLGIPWTDPLFALLIFFFILVTTLLAGSYPAFFLSGFRPVKVLKGDLHAGPGASLPRKILVVLQLIISISLVVGAILVSQQIRFAKDRPVGYSRTGLLNIGKNTSDLYKARYDALRTDLLRTNAVTAMAESAVPATELPEASHDLSWQGQTPGSKPSFTEVWVTPDYGPTIGWQLVAGHDFDRSLPADSEKLIINESAARLIGFSQPIGQQVRLYGDRYTIIGVVRDMVMASPFQHVLPGFFRAAPDSTVNDILIRVRPGISMRQALAAIEKVFRKYNPGSPFDYRFVDTDYALKFADQERIDGLARAFTALAIFISCLGLFGLAAYTAEQRTREIGIRKVLGSSVFSIWQLLTGETIRLILLACAIALPLSGLLMHRWLLQYSYRTPLSWWVFAAAAGGALGIALLTVSFHALKAAHTPPVKTLHTQ